MFIPTVVVIIGQPSLWKVSRPQFFWRCINLYWLNTVTEVDVHFMGFYQISRAGWLPYSYWVQIISNSRGVKYLSYTGVCVNPTSDLSVKWNGDFTSPVSLDTAPTWWLLWPLGNWPHTTNSLHGHHWVMMPGKGKCLWPLGPSHCCPLIFIKVLPGS